MSTAIIAVTARGAAVAARLARSLAGPCDVFVHQGKGEAIGARTFDRLETLMPRLFTHYQRLVFIMAAGIVVRVIASWVRDKYHDPAVVVVDEAARHAVSLLAGHLGGANDLAREVAAVLGAEPVITTATDVHGLVAPDVLAGRLHLVLEPREAVKPVNAALAAGRKVAFFLDHTCPAAAWYQQRLAHWGVESATLTTADAGEYEAAVLLTDRLLSLPRPHVFLRPRTIAVGVGCRRGTPAGHIIQAIELACRRAGRSTSSIAAVCSADVKRQETGIREAAEYFHAPARFFPRKDLERLITQRQLTISAFVQREIGVGGVCEPAAILGAGGGPLLLSKMRQPGVTVALAAVISPLSAWDRADETK